MIVLQFFNSHKHLFYLVCFGLSLIILNIYSWITLPRRFIYPMAATCLTCFPKIIIAYFAQIIISNPLGISLHLQQHIFDFSHVYIVSLLISLSKSNLDDNKKGEFRAMHNVEVSCGPNEFQVGWAFTKNRYLHAVCSTGLLGLNFYLDTYHNQLYIIPYNNREVSNESHYIYRRTTKPCKNDGKRVQRPRTHYRHT